MNDLRSFAVIIYNKTYDLSKKSYLRFTGAAVGVVALVWWCVLYPELCFPKDTYEVVYETDEANEDIIFNVDDKIENENIESKEASVIYPEILQADDEHIVIKSRLLEWISQKK